MKRTVITALFILVMALPLFADEQSEDIQAEDLAATATDTGAPLDQAPAPVTLTSAEYVTPEPRPASEIFVNSVGFEVGIPGRVIPGISYTRYFFKSVFVSMFGGAMYDGASLAGLAQASGFYRFGNYLYAGLGVAMLLDEDGSVLCSFCNPSVGMTADITDRLRLFVQVDVMVLNFASSANTASADLASNPFPIFKSGIRYAY